jgi:retron-type reverse transcriptase
MKRYGNLWKQITDIETLRNAHQLAKRGKSHYSSVKEVEKDVEGHLIRLQQALLDKTFTTSDYIIEDRIEGGKMRRIYKLPYYPDRIVQHALMAAIGPIFRRSLIRDTFQSLPNRGTSDARRRVQKMMKSDPQRYALKMDIRQYYPSINNDLLKKAVRRKIKCKDTLWLMDNIIESRDGLPIGNLTSQYFGNVFLTRFDWWVKQELAVKHYYRYCDDLVLFCDSKSKLREWRRQIVGYLNAIGLEIKSTWQIVDTRLQGVDFVGYIFQQSQTRLRRTIAERFIAHAQKSRKMLIAAKRAIDGLVAYKGWIMRCNAKELWRANVTNRVANYCGNVYKTNPLKGCV